MILNISSLTNAFKRLQSTIKDVKVMPGILVDLTDGKFDMCYTDGKVAYMERLDVEREDGDLSEKIVLNYDEFLRVISNCQPSNGIAVRGFKLTFNDSTIADVEVEQGTMSDDNEEFYSRGVKRFKLPFKMFDISDRRMSLLSRVDYNAIFEADGVEPDKWDRKKLAKIMNALSKSDEAATPIYFSSKIQWAYTLTNAYTIAFPLEPLSEVTDEEKAEVRATCTASGMSEETIEEKINKLGKQQTFQMVTTSAMATMIYNVLSKMSCESVYMYVANNFIYIYDENDTIACQFETGKMRNNAVYFNNYRAMSYDKANLTFARNFLIDTVKTSANNSGDDTVGILFEEILDEDSNSTGEYNMIFNVSDKNKNIRDKYELSMDGCTAKEENEVSVLKDMQFSISLSVVNTVISLMDEEFIGMDFSESVNSTIYLRLSDINRDKFLNKIESKMTELGRELTFEEKIDLRKEYIGTTAFILIKEK